MLELPPTIRQPFEDEILNSEEVQILLKRRETAKLIEGYKISPNNSHDLPFKFYAEININNSKLWDLFISLTKILPDNIGTIYNYYEDEPFYAPYHPKEDIINALSLYKLELTQDGFLEFGVIFNTEDKLEEIFIPEAKYIKFWGVNESSFRQIMNDYSLKEIPDINFIDEFPKVVESLSIKNKSAKDTRTVINELNSLIGQKKKSNWKFWE